MTDALKSLQQQAEELVKHYVHLTGREARVSIYEHQIFDFIRAGFTCEEFVLVVKFLVSENKRNKFQYSLKFGALVQDHGRFMDLLGESKARERNKIKPVTPKEAVMEQWRPSACERVTGNSVHKISEFLKLPHQ